MLANINNDTKEVKLVSVYRDTYLDTRDGIFQKCNAAYAKGGPEQAISMLNVNLDFKHHRLCDSRLQLDHRMRRFTWRCGHGDHR